MVDDEDDISSLHNPNGVVAIHHKNGTIIEAGEEQGFQEYPGSYELWGMFEGNLVRIKRWLKKSIVFTYTKDEQ